VGIYVQGYGTIRPSSPDDFAARLIGCAKSWAAARGLDDLFYASSSDAGAWLTFYPPAGGIAFEIGAESIGFGAKTSTAGPGYHAALIDLCDQLRAQLGIAWRWDGGADQTNYAVERNLVELKEAFLDQVLAWCEFHRDNVGPGETYALNLPEGWVADGYDGVATPLGIVPGQQFLDTLDDPSEAEALAKRIFPWWSLETDQEFWLNTLRALLWTEVEWRGARTSWETHVHSAALALGKRVGSFIDVPLRRAVDELAWLSIKGDDRTAPVNEGIGYLRRKRAFFLPGPWRINLPGYYIEQIEDDGNTTCLWFGEEEVRGTSFTMAPKEGREEDGFIWGDELADQSDHDGNGLTYRHDPAPRPSSNCPGFFDATAEFQTRAADGNTHLLILSLFSREENLIPRLEEIAKGVWLEGPRRGDVEQGH
jgi:hypothetical protein